MGPSAKVIGAYDAARTWSSVFALPGAMYLDAALPVRPQLMQNVTVPCIGWAAGKFSLFMPCGLEGHVYSPAILE